MASTVIDILPKLDKEGFDALKKQLEELSKIGVIKPGQGANASTALKEGRQASQKAQRALDQGNNKQFQIEVGNLIENIKKLLLTFSTSNVKINAEFDKLSKTIAENNAKMLDAAKELAKLKAQKAKDYETAAISNSKHQIGYLGKGQRLDSEGNPTTFAKSQKSIASSVFASQKDNAN